MGLSIRNLTEADLVIANEIARLAYNSTMDYQPSLRRHLTLQPDGWILAVLDGKPVGLVGAINYGPFAYIGTMSVLPTVQRRGIGYGLMEYLLHWLKQQNCPTVFLDATDVGLELYRHFKFVTEDKTAHWLQEEGMSLPPLYSHPTSHLSQIHQATIAELTSFDATYFGAERAAVFTQLLLEYPERAFVTRNAEGQISGYLFAQTRNLGPWVAENVEDAEVLLRHALTLSFAGAPTVLSSASSGTINRLLTTYGFEQMRVLHHMSSGSPTHLRKRSMIYGQVNFALG